jgi:hypothetical protein
MHEIIRIAQMSHSCGDLAIQSLRTKCAKNYESMNNANLEYQFKIQYSKNKSMAEACTLFHESIRSFQI